MENHISAQLLLFGQSVALGIGAGLLYDLLRPVRIRLPRLTGLLDGLYCLTDFLCLFLFLLRRAGGELRLYALVGLVGGAVMHFGIFSPPLRPVWDFWADTVAWGLELAALPIRRLTAFTKKVLHRCKNLFYFAGKWVTIEKIGVYPHMYKRGAGDVSARRAKGKKSRAGFFTKLLLLVLLVGLGWQLYRLQGQVEAARAQKAQLAARVEQQQQENDALQKGIDNGGSQEEKERIAREELGLVSPGERVYYDTGN